MSNNPSADPPADMPTTSPSLARRLYDIHEIRQEILRYLPRKDLAAFIRVEKECVGAVIRELYRTVPRSIVLREDVPEERKKMYLNSVLTIYFDDSYVSNRIQDDPTGAMLHAAIPSLRRKCPKLSRIGSHPVSRGKEAASWVVDLVRTPNHTEPSIDQPSTARGRITYVKTRSYSAHNDPPARFGAQLFSSPSSDYTVRTRFNLILNSEKRPQTYRFSNTHGVTPSELWLQVLQSDPHFAQLYRVLQLGPVSMSLRQIGSLYQKQKDAGYVDRLSDIQAPTSPPFRLKEFEGFAKLALTSLSSLILVDKSKIHTHCTTRTPLITLADLPGLTTIVRRHLPNLRKFHFRLGHSANHEAECQRLLYPEMLEPGGSINDLLIITPSSDYSFNVIRCLCPLVTAIATVGLGKGDPQGKSYQRQTAFLRYLKQQPHHRRIHLAMVDFSSLGIPWLNNSGLRSVLGLAYYDNGLPRIRVESEAIRWRAWADAVRVPASLVEELSPLVAAAAEGAARLEASSKGEDDLRTLADMQSFLARTQAKRRKRKELTRTLMEDDAVDCSDEHEICHSIKLLKAKLGLGE